MISNNAILWFYLWQGRKLWPWAWDLCRVNEWGNIIKSKTGSLWLVSPLSSFFLDRGSRCSSALVLLFVAGQPGSWLKDGVGGVLVPLFIFFLHSLHNSLSICVCLIQPGWWLSDDLIPWLRFLVPLNKRLHIWIDHMALIGAIHSHFGCNCTSYRASALRLIYHHSAAAGAIYVPLLLSASVSISQKAHTKTKTHTSFACVSEYSMHRFGKEPAPLIPIRSCRESCSGDGYLSGPSSTFPGERKGACSKVLQPGTQMVPVMALCGLGKLK